MSDLFAPEGGWKVRILDLSGASDDKLVEEVAGFPTLMQANAFARAYVRDSVDRCRAPGMSSRAVLDAWFAFGEDAEITDNPQGAWRSATELAEFGERPGSEEDRDWRALDPRLEEDEDDED
ncbi:hypothetical protein [Acidisphaera sp. L21]|uniref:hypothetical protein n=1 Tax=Acidisphaera sp. L21 TaxID=1641851 RepID=UPI00131DBD15|nr:hypothetical protein [Acidisphaera sp. L21]